MGYEWWVPESSSVPTILLLSTSDTDLIAARASGAAYRWANPSRLVDGELAELLDGADLGRRADPRRVPRLAGRHRRRWSPAGVPAVVVSGEQAPDAELMSHSTVPAGVALQAHVYLAQGGVENLRAAARLPVRHRADDRRRLRSRRPAPRRWGVLERRPAPTRRRRPDGRRALLPGPAPGGQHRATSRRCAGAIEDAGGRPLPIFCASLRTAEPELLDLLGTADAMVTTVLAAGGAMPADGRRPAATTTAGTSAHWPRWTSRSCRGCA